jgi:hypothetical protein
MYVEKFGRTYWFLYEGTPYGKFDKSTNYLIRSDLKDRNYLGSSKGGDIKPADGQSCEWIAFGDKNVKRMMVLVQHEDNTGGDNYYPMSPMTVFGFGRPSGTKKALNQKHTFTVSLLEADTWQAAYDHVSGLLSGTTVTTPRSNAGTTRLTVLQPGGRTVRTPLDMRGRRLGGSVGPAAVPVTFGPGSAPALCVLPQQ